MQKEAYLNDVDYLRQQLKRLVIVCLVLTAALLSVTVLTILLFGKDRTVIVPTNFSKTFHVTNSTISASGLEELAAWITSLKLNVTPSSIELANELVLRNTDPAYHGVMAAAQNTQVLRMKSDNSATAFTLSTIAVQADRYAAIVTGVLTVYVNGKQVSADSKKFFLRFTIRGGSAQLRLFNEVSHDDLAKLLADNPV